MRKFLTLSILCFSALLHAQTYPTFGREITVTINGDTVPDAMEPFISPDGNYLFFNSLNNGTTTTLYYCTKVNDSVFTFAGPLTGANLTAPHLDAVASLDSANRFFWVTTRNYGSTYYNVFHGVFTGSGVIDTGRVYGTLYIKTPGWIVMDAAINYNGSLIYYANAYFNGCSYGLPCISQLGIAQKVNDSTYNKVATSDAQLYKVNDTGYLVYAENVTEDGLELYYTRVKKYVTPQTEICVAVRNAVADTFSSPSVIYTNPGYSIEAPTLTIDKTRLYYHKKTATNFKLYLRYRNSVAGLNKLTDDEQITIYPNPSNDKIIVRVNSEKLRVNSIAEVYNMLGQKVYSAPIAIHNSQFTIDVSGFAPGSYALIISNENRVFVRRFTRL